MRSNHKVYDMDNESCSPKMSDTRRNSSSTLSEEEAAAALLLAAGGNNSERHSENKSQDDVANSNRPQQIEDLYDHGSNNSTKSCFVSPTVSVSSSNIGNSNEQSNSEQNQTPHHFPSQLHEFLTSSEYAGVVVEWLPHGLSWRVLRWEALKSDVIQKYFPQCSADPEGFTWQINAWGFNEIRSGSDRGSFQHNVSFQIAFPLIVDFLKENSIKTHNLSLKYLWQLFLRDRPKICKKMRLNVHSMITTSDDPGKHHHNAQYLPYTEIQVTPSRSVPIVDAPSDSSCTPPQVLRNSFPVSTENSPIEKNKSQSSVDQNVFRQRMFVTPRKQKLRDGMEPSITTIDEGIFPWVTLQRYQDKHAHTGKERNQSHSSTVSESTSPNANLSQSSFSPQPHLTSCHDSPKNEEMNHNRKINVRFVYSDDNSPENKMNFDASTSTASSINNQKEIRQTAIANPFSKSFQSQQSQRRSPSGLRSARGRSRVVRSSQNIPPQSSQSQKSKVITVSSRGGSKKRPCPSRATKHVYTVSSTQFHDVYNLQMFSHESQSQSPYSLPYQQQDHQNLQTQTNPSHPEDRRDENVIAMSSPLLRSSPYPVAIAVSRKTKHFRPQT